MDKAGGSADEALSRDALERAAAAVSEEKTSVESKLSSLSKYWDKLNNIADILSSARKNLRTTSPAEVSKIIADREAEVKEVIGNFANLERECQIVGQSVSPQLRVSVVGSCGV